MTDQDTKLVIALADMVALFDDEGNFREQFQDQAALALERADKRLEEAFIALGRAGANADVHHGGRKAWEAARRALSA